KPWDLSQFGPIAFQPGRLLHYAVYFFAGIAVGAHGLERGVLQPAGKLALRWGTWLGSALAAFVLWMALTGLTMHEQGAAARFFGALADLLFALSSATASFALVAIFLRF